MAKGKFYDEFLMAATLGDVSKIRALIASGENPNQTGSHGSILAGATWYNNAEAVRTLLDAGAKPNFNKGDALLSSVSSPNQNKNAPEVVRLLAAKGADLNRVYDVQSEIPQATPLMIAIFFGYTRLAEALIELGADVHYMSEKGQSAFTLAADGNMQKIGQKLIDRGFKPNLKNKFQKKFAVQLKKPEEKTDNFMHERYYLVPARVPSPHSTGNPQPQEIMAEKNLPLCPNPPVHLLTLDLAEIPTLPAKIRKLGKLHVPFYYCSDCNGESDALDFGIGKNGKLKLLTAVKGKVHDCSVNGFFIGQISQSLVPPGHGGPDNAIYIFVCGDCRTEMIVRQMT